jgi:hypothetical protein
LLRRSGDVERAKQSIEHFRKMERRETSS